MKQLLTIFIITLVFGCSPKQSPESKAEIAHFVSSDIKAYITTMSPGSVDLAAMVEAFPPILEKWKSIKQRTALPPKKVERIECALNLHRLILMTFETPLDEQGLSPEKEKELYLKQRAHQKELHEGITEAHWDRLRGKLKDPVFKDPNKQKALDDYQQHQSSYMYPSATADIIIANFSEFIDPLASLTK